MKPSKNAYVNLGAGQRLIFDDLIYYQKPSDNCPFLDEVPENQRNLNVSDSRSECAYLAGSAQYESEGLPQYEGRVPEIGDYLYRYRFCPSLQTCLNNTC